MTTPRQAWARLVSFFRKKELDREFDEELAAHIELATQDHIRQGKALPEARRLALLKLGGVELSKQVHRETRGLPWLDGIVQDIRYAVRAMRRSPGFTLAAIAMLALGIGVNAAVFTVTNAVLFKGFSYIDRHDRILYMTSVEGCCVSYPDFEDWRAQAKSFEGMAIVHGVQIVLSDKNGFPEYYYATEVSADTFKLIGQRPILGRDFAAPDETPGAAPVAILNYGFWERRYGKDPTIIGRTVRMNGALTTVIGVMARGFYFPQNQDLWVPLVPTPNVLRREARDTWFVFGRVTDGITMESARAEMETIGRRLERAYPLTNGGFLPVVRKFHEFYIGPHAALIYGSMWGAVGFVLLIACANLANLMLARAMVRSREISLRIALGAGRWRIIRQLLIESLMLSGLGGFFGWWIAKWGTHTYQLAAKAPGYSWFDHVLDYTMDYRVFVYLVAISIGTGILFGLAPATRLSKLDVNSTLKDGGRGATGGGRGKHLSALLVIAEMALAVVLLAGAGVMIRSFLNVYTADLGVQTEKILTAGLNLPVARYSHADARVSFYDLLQTRVEAIPGVESMAIASYIPTWNVQRFPFELAGAPPVDERRRPKISVLIISPAYFRTLGAAVLSGREFNEGDGVLGLPVLIVNQRFASRYWPGENPLGKRVRLFEGNMPGPWRTVVGAVSNIAQNDVARPESNFLVYLPYRQMPYEGGINVLVRARVPPGTLGNAFRQEVHALDSDLPMFGPFTLADRLLVNYWDRRLYGALFLIFAAIALLLASLGLYSVIAHSVSRRTQEIGIRMAIGAAARDVLKLIFVQGLLPVGIGLTIGLGASLAVNRVLESELVQVSPSDPITLVVVSVVLILAALLGCLIPARHAMRVDPVIALRHD